MDGNTSDAMVTECWIRDSFGSNGSIVAGGRTNV